LQLNKKIQGKKRKEKLEKKSYLANKLEIDHENK
jgi:hypothetical protein